MAGPRTREPPASGIGPLVHQSAFDRGVLLPSRAMRPPIIIKKIDELMAALRGAIDDGYAEVVRKGLVGGEVKKAG